MKRFLVSIVALSALLVACNPEPNGEEPTQTPPAVEVDPNLNVAVVRATDSTITIGWTITESNVPYIGQIEPSPEADYSEDITKQYRVSLYNNSACTNVEVSVSPIQENMVDAKALYNSKTCPPRFVFTGLKQRTTYYVKVENLTDGTSNAKALRVVTKASVADKKSVVTTNAQPSDIILFENFDGLIYAGDITSRGAGLSRTDRGSLNSFSDADCKGEITVANSGYYMTGADVEIGLFNTLKGILDEAGIDGWGWIGGKSGATGGSICARPGYVKIGTTANRSFICTPLLSAIPDDKEATVEVKFKAVTYGTM